MAANQASMARRQRERARQQRRREKAAQRQARRDEKKAAAATAPKGPQIDWDAAVRHTPLEPEAEATEVAEVE